MKFDPFAHPEKLLAMLKEEKWYSYYPGFYPLSVRRCGADLYIFFAPTFRPIGISSKAGADYCSKIFSQDILYAGTLCRTDLLREVVVIKICKPTGINHIEMMSLYGIEVMEMMSLCGPAEDILSWRGNWRGSKSLTVAPWESNSSKEDCARNIFGILERWSASRSRSNWEKNYIRCALFKSIAQLRDLMDIGPGKRFFLKASSPYLFRAIADDFYDEDRGEDHDLAEDEELGDLIHRGRKIETGACPADFYSAPPDQGAVGKKPTDYFMRLPSADQPDPVCLAKIPHRGMAKLTRDQVRAIARDSSIPPLAAYACIMAWGGQRMNHFVSSLDTSTLIRRLVEYLRDSSRDRAQDFDYVTGKAALVKGLSISFYTKLLFFLREKPNAYILDQWTAKSARLLFPELNIRLTAQGLPDPGTTPREYEEYCSALESCCGPRAWGDNWQSGEEIERGLFDKPGGKWRQHVISHVRADRNDPLDSLIDWLMEMFESERREIPEEPEPEQESELDELSRELEERLEGRRIRIRPGRRRICRLLGLYSPTERLVTLFPRMWKLVAAGAGAPSAEEIGVITTLHEFAHAVSHVSHKEWALQDFIQTPVGIHEIIAERCSLKILPLYEDLLPKSDLPDVHLWLCKDAPAEYRFWKLLESVDNLGFASTLADWRKSGVHRDDDWVKDPAEFLKDRGADLRATAASDRALANALDDLKCAFNTFKNPTALLSQPIKPAAGGKSIDLKVIEALEACWEPILFGKSAALRKEFSSWCWYGEKLLQLDREQLRIRLVEWLVALHAGRKAGSKGAWVAAILDPDDDDWADLIRDVVSEFDLVI